MLCLIKSMKAWAQLLRPQVLSYQLPIYSNGTDTGTVTVAGETNDYTGDWLILDGRPYVIKSCAPRNGMTAITCQLPECAFSRSLACPAAPASTVGGFISAAIGEFIDETDPEFAMPYLTVSNLDQTALTLELRQNELYSPAEFIRQAAADGVYLTWTPGVAGMAVSIAARQQAERNLFFGDGHTQLVSQTYTASLIVKATVREISEDPDTGAISVLSSDDFYWHPDGTVSDTPPDPRIPGEWTVVDVKEGEDLQTAAAAAMGKNTAGCKIEFYSDRDLQQNDAVTCRIGSLVVRAVIAFRRISGADRRIFYRAGTAAVTLTDKLRGGTRVLYLTAGSGGLSSVTFVSPVGSTVSWTGTASGSVELGEETSATVQMPNGGYVVTSALDGVTLWTATIDVAGDATVPLYPEHALWWYGISAGTFEKTASAAVSYPDDHVIRATSSQRYNEGLRSSAPVELSGFTKIRARVLGHGALPVASNSNGRACCQRWTSDSTTPWSSGANTITGSALETLDSVEDIYTEISVTGEFSVGVRFTPSSYNETYVDVYALWLE